MKTLFRMYLIAALLGASAWADPAPAEEDLDATHGWTPALAAKWQEAQRDYAQAVKQYGPHSPEATGAQVLMRTRARELGIQAPEEIPESEPLPPPDVSIPLTDLESSTDTLTTPPEESPQ